MATVFDVPKSMPSSRMRLTLTGAPRGPRRVILPGVAHRFPYLDAPTPIAFAHRGGAEPGDENTLAAFARAVELGYRYVETDVRATADGVAVVFHDATLDRLTGRAGRVADLRWRDLATLRVAGSAAVPRLDEVLEHWPEIRFNIDVKHAAGAEPTVAAVRAAGAAHRVLLASFDDARLALLRTLAGPDVATSLGRRAAAALRVASLTGRRLRLPPSVAAAQVPPRYGPLRVVDRRFVRYAHRLGLHVHVWTIDDPADMHDLLDLGADGIMTDRVEVLRDVFRSRGQWVERR
jgi:glycerophosphoryl diester phosphodiesterase